MAEFTKKHPITGGRQKGTTTVEFAIVGVVVFLVLFSVMEVARLIFTWNTLNEASRRAARLATVCRVEEVIGGVVTDAVVSQMGSLLPGFTSDNLIYQYLKADGSSSFPPHSAAYVRASIVNYQYEMILPLSVNLSQLAPDFSTTLRTESMGKTKPTTANPDGNIICSETGGAGI